MSKKSIYEEPKEGVVLENGKVKEKFSFDDVEERTIDIKKLKTKTVDESKRKPTKKTTKTKKTIENELHEQLRKAGATKTNLDNLKDAMEYSNALQEAFENLFLSDEELEEQGASGLESLKTINTILEKHKVDRKSITKAFNAAMISAGYEKANPKIQLDKIKKIIGDTPNIDTEAAINNILEEVMALVPEGMSYFEFMKEYKLVAKPRVSFFAKLFGKK